MIAKLKQVFRVVLAEAERNQAFRQELEHALGQVAAKPKESSDSKKPKNRRTAAVLNPYDVLKEGEQTLHARLQSLEIEQLKDIVSAFAIDSSKLALKWKSRERLIQLIVTTIKGRLEKGDAFRQP